MIFWDCNAAIGPWTIPPPGGALDAAGLRAELAEHGIAGGLVHHGLARDYDPAVGNGALLRELDGLHDQLVPCATLLPHHTGEFPPPHEHVPRLVAQGVRAVRVYPKSHNFSLAAWSAGELLGALETHRVPLSVELAETTWDQLHEICAAHPNLPVVVTRVGYRVERFLFPLWERHAGLHVDVSHFQAHRAIEEAVGRFGARRLLFGTGLPFYSAGASVLAVVRAEVDDGAREAIAGQNLRRLIDGVRSQV